MLPRSYLALSFATLATVGFAAGCSGSAHDEAVMRVTLSGDGCRYEGSTTPAPGSVAIDVRNDTNEKAAFALMKLPRGATLKDVETWFHQVRTGRNVRRRLSWISSTHVAPHAASELTANIPAGRLVVLCAPGDQRRNDVIAAAALDLAPDG
jgi:hypothetical protein